VDLRYSGFFQHCSTMYDSLFAWGWDSSKLWKDWMFVPTTIYYSSSFKCYDRKRSNLIFFRRIYFFDSALPAETLRKRMAEVIKSVRKFPKPKNETKKGPKKTEKGRKRLNLKHETKKRSKKLFGNSSKYQQL